MSKMIAGTTEQSGDTRAVTIADGTNHPDVSTLQEYVNIIIDFSYPGNLTWIRPSVPGHVCTYICGTTGYDDIQKYQVEELSSVAPVVFQVNFSLGIAVFRGILQMTTPMLEESSDMKIVKEYHSQKRGAPSGTAKILVAAMNREHIYREIHRRNGFIGKRQEEIGIHAVRDGIATEKHDVYFSRDDETLEIKRIANSHEIFVNGVLCAAHFVATQRPGMHTMKDILFVRGGVVDTKEIIASI